MKPVPVLGTAVLIGAIIQLLIGFQVAEGSQALVGPHIIIGIVGLLLVVVLTAIAFRVKTATVYSKITITILTVIVLVQAVMGFQILGGSEALVMSHEMNAFAILLLALLAGGITFWSAKRHAQFQM